MRGDDAAPLHALEADGLGGGGSRHPAVRGVRRRRRPQVFLGYRVRFGKQQNDWDLDTFALQPLERLKYQWDKPDEDTWFYGGILSIRRWSEFITIQPYFMGRKVNGDPTNSVVRSRKADQDIYAPGLRVYGVFPNSNFDFDADINKQFGRVGKLTGTRADHGES